ncbi:MAG TPA: hypothetical protein VGF34_12230 [Stellaceae bacterium]|jgi:hypothetical protein
MKIGEHYIAGHDVLWFRACLCWVKPLGAVGSIEAAGSRRRQYHTNDGCWNA